MATERYKIEMEVEIEAELRTAENLTYWAMRGLKDDKSIVKKVKVEKINATSVIPKVIP